jgi:hypothetical protein
MELYAQYYVTQIYNHDMDLELTDYDKFSS